MDERANKKNRQAPDSRNKLPLRPGAWAALVEDLGDISEQAINERISRIISDAYAAGFATDVKSIRYGRCGYIIHYELAADAAFRDPIG